MEAAGQKIYLTNHEYTDGYGSQSRKDMGKI